jgi:hypothetical protein
VPIGGIHAVLSKACDALQAQPNVTVHTMSTGATPVETTIKIAGPEAMSVDSKLDNKEVQMTVISPTVYSNENGTWKKSSSPQGAAGAMGFMRIPTYAFVCVDEFSDDAGGGAFKIDSLASGMALPEMVDGVPTLTYIVKGEVNSADGKSSGTIKYWLGATESLPHKFTLDYIDTKGQQGSAAGSYTYDKPDLQAPIP